MPFTPYRSSLDPETLAVAQVALDMGWTEIEAASGGYDVQLARSIASPRCPRQGYSGSIPASGTSFAFALPTVEDLRRWAQTTLGKLSGRSELAKAFRYMLARWPALIRCFKDGRLEIDNNPAEQALLGIAVGRKNYLFAGSDRGGERAAAIYSLIETAKLNGLDPQAWMRDVLDRIADHPNSRIGELLSWNWLPATPAAEAA